MSSGYCLTWLTSVSILMVKTGKMAVSWEHGIQAKGVSTLRQLLKGLTTACIPST